MSDIDREVAEKVMGWNVHEVQGEDWYVTPSGFLARLSSDWSPSTRIDHAWEVVEKLRQLFDIEVCGISEAVVSKEGCDRRWYCHISEWGGPTVAFSEAETAPLAICKAALEALESRTD